MQNRVFVINKHGEALIKLGENPVILITGWIALAYFSKLLI